MKQVPWRQDASLKVEAPEKDYRKPWVAPAGIAAGVMLFALGFISRYKITIVFGLVIVLANIMKKYIAFTVNGLETFYDMYFTSSHNIIEWKDIDAITYEDAKKRTDAIIVYVTRGDITKKVMFAKKDAKKIISFAKKCKPSVKVYDGNEYRRKMKQR